MASIVYTEDHSAGFIARVVLGLAILPHGLQKTLALFGGTGLLPTLDGLEGIGIPYVIGAFVIAAESLGALALIFGVFGRVVSASIMIVMLGSILKVHAKFGFFMNWSGLQEGEGFEYHILAIGLGLIVLILGSGSLSFDRWLTRRFWA
jgi:putative oxidoreductase